MPTDDGLPPTLPCGTGLGSMPGTDVTAAVRTIADEVGLVHVPELPDRGPHAAMLGRTLALLVGLEADLQPQGWRLGVGRGRDQHRARATLRQDLDLVEEVLAAHAGPVKIQLAGPLTLAACVERPRGDKLLADHGARREVAESLAEGVREHVADLRRRFAGRAIVVQVDEPALPAVLAARVPTASGYATHRAVATGEAVDLLGRVTEAVVAAGGRPVAHCCAPDVPVGLLGRSGFGAVSFDLALASSGDAWAEAFEAGVDLWPGAVPTSGPAPSDTVLVEQVRTFFGRLGFAASTVQPRLVVTPSCGLAGTPRGDVRAILRAAQTTAENVGDAE